MSIELTQNEIDMLTAFIEEGANVNGATEVDHILHDNMTWMSASDLVTCLDWSAQKVGGTMAALELKGLIVNSGESARGARDMDWFASDRGIKLGWPYYQATLVD